MTHPNKPIRNVYYAIDLILKGYTLDSFRDRIEVRDGANQWWAAALGGASVVMRHRGYCVETNREFKKLIEHVEMMP